MVGQKAGNDLASVWLVECCPWWVLELDDVVLGELESRDGRYAFPSSLQQISPHQRPL